MANESDGKVPSGEPTPTTSQGTDGGVTNSQQQFYKKNPNSGNFMKDPKFEGRIAELLGNIYDCGYKQADTFTKTTKEIAEYIGRTLQSGEEIMTGIEDLVTPVLPVPVDPDEDATKSEVRIWEKEIDEYVKSKRILRHNLIQAYMIVWGQCTDVMRTKLEAREGHSEIARKKDVVELLKNIKDIAFSFQSQRYEYHSLHDAKRRFYHLSQEKGMPCGAYLERFKNQVDVVSHCGGSVIDDAMIKKQLRAMVAGAKPSDVQIERAKQIVTDKYLGCAFILGSDRTRYGKLLEDLENSYLQGDNKYPTNVDEAHSLISYWKQDPRNVVQSLGPDGAGMAFITQGDQNKEIGKEKDKNKKDLSKITCFNCYEKGHYSNNCPNPKKAEQNNEMVHLQTGNDGYDNKENITTSFQF
jgi:Zinc knuckle